MSTTWNLKLLYKSDNDPQIEKDIKAAQTAWKKFITKWKKDDSYLNDPKSLCKALEEYEELSTKYGLADKPNYYFWLKKSLEQDNPEVKARVSKIDDIATKLDNELQFFMLNVCKIPRDKQSKFLEYKPLAKYKHYLERAFTQGKYLLTDAEEKIFNLVNKPSYSNWVEMISEFISKEEREILNEKGKKELAPFSQILGNLNSTNKKVRDAAARCIHEITEKYADTATTELNSILEYKKVNDELRGYERPDKHRHRADDIDSEVVDALITSVSDRFDISQRYYKLKSQIFKTKKLTYHERNVPVGEIKQEFTFEKAKDIVLQSYKDLDEELYILIKAFFDEERIDVYPKKGKRGGAFCVHETKSLPVFVLLNHNNKINDVTTLAHELGHGVNDELMRIYQNELNYGTFTSTAEVASTFFEDFTLQNISKTLNEEDTFTLLMEKLNDDISSIFRQIALYKFEQEIHKSYRENGYVSREELGKIFSKHMAAYMGKYVSQDKGAENWWVHWSHIRRFFYVYSYSSGLLISKSMQNMVKKDKKSIEKVKTFLSTGTSKSPKDIFMGMNIDITNKDFWNKGLDEVEELLNICESLAKKLGKI